MPYTLPADCRIVVSGNTVRDTIVRAVEELNFGATTWVESVLPSLGGNGANTACSLAKLGIPVTLISGCGEDEAGSACVRSLSEAGVETMLERSAEFPTAVTIALVNAAGERAFLHQPGVNKVALAGPVEFLGRVPAGHWHYHLANPFSLPSFRDHAAESLQRALALGATTSLDTGWDSKGYWLDDLGPCLPLADWLFVNDREAEQLTGKREAGEMVSQLHRLGAKRIVLKLGASGCLLSDRDDRELIPAFSVDVVDSTGAGDVFVAGFLAALVKQMSPLEAARFACAVAALSVMASGSVTGLRSFEGTLGWMLEQDDEA